MSYRAAVLVAPGKLVLEERPCPEPGPWDAVLRPLRVGVCGTDLALWSGSYRVPLPLVPGHEIVAEIVALGERAREEGFRVGERVVPEINATCLARRDPEPCPACRAGLERHCQRRTVVGIVSHDGGFAERLVVPVGALHRVGGLPDERAVFVEPVAAAFETFAMGGSPEGRTVVVLGAGRLGTLVVAVARSLGARVAAVARSERSLERARRFGAEAAFPADGELPAAVRRFAGPLGADFVVECTGEAATAERALDLVRPRGTVVVKSTPGLAAPLSLTRLVVDELRLVGSRCGDFPDAIRWLRETRLPVESLVEAEFPLERLAEALEAARRLAKVVVRPQD